MKPMRPFQSLKSHFQHCFLCAVIVCLSIQQVVMAQEAVKLIDVQLNSQQDQRIDIDLIFDGPAPPQSSYAISNPNRLVTDLVNTKHALNRRVMTINEGLLQEIVLAQSANKLRLVSSLRAPINFEFEPLGNVLRLTITPQVPLASTAAQNASSDAEAEEQTTATESDRTQVNQVDFRRLENNAGRVVVEFAGTAPGLRVLRESDNVVINFPDARLPAFLEKRLDVIDFATPVNFIDSFNTQQGVSIIVRAASSRYDYVTYQTDNQLLIDFTLPSNQNITSIPNEPVYEGQRIDLNFQNVDLRAVLQIIADVAEMNLVVSDQVQGSTTILLRDVPWDQALDIVLRSNGLEKREVGNVLMIGTVEEIAQRELLEAQSLNQVQDIAPLQTEFIQIDYRVASEIKERLEQARLVSERGFVLADDQTNQLMVREIASRLAEIKRTISQFDVAVAQIQVEARVVETTSREAQELGVRWGFGSEQVVLGAGNLMSADYVIETTEQTTSTTLAGSPSSSSSSSSTSDSGSDSGTSSGDSSGSDSGSTDVASVINDVVTTTNRFWDFNPLATPLIDLGVAANPSTLSLGIITGSNLLALELKAMESEGRLNVVSQPRVVTANGQEALISSGQKIPYRIITDGETTVNFEEVDLRLLVTPQINPGDRINLRLKINKDAIGGQTPAGDLIIDRNFVQTGVTVNNGETLVLGGVFINQENASNEKVPFLGDLPIIGQLFRYKLNTSEKRELLIFITPTLIKESLSVR